MQASCHLSMTHAGGLSVEPCPRLLFSGEGIISPTGVSDDVFAKQLVSVDDRVKVQNRVQNLQIALRTPHDLMLFSAKAEDLIKQIIYNGVLPYLAIGLDLSLVAHDN